MRINHHHIFLQIALAAVALSFFLCGYLSADEPINPTKLEKGKTYRLSHPVILYPSREKPRTTEEFKDIKKIPRHGTIRILKRAEDEERIWYFVSARDSKGEKIGKGWVMSGNLAGQRLEKVSGRESRASNRDAIRLMKTIWGDKLRQE